MTTRIRVLVVDDEPRFRENLVRLLALQGFDAASAPGGHEALAILRENRFDVAVVDMKMPVMDGMETLRGIRLISDAPACIILTGHVCMDDAVEGMRCGAAEYLLKPCSTDDLAERICRAYERRREHTAGLCARG